MEIGLQNSNTNLSFLQQAMVKELMRKFESLSYVQDNFKGKTHMIFYSCRAVTLHIEHSIVFDTINSEFGMQVITCQFSNRYPDAFH